MSDTPFIKFFPSDFLAGTSGLTPAERGVYITILCLMWDGGGPVALDDGRLARRCGMPKAAYLKAKKALIEEGKLVATPDGLSNKRAEQTLMDRLNRIQTATHAARQRWGAGSEKSEQNQDAVDPNALPEQCRDDAKPEARSQNKNDDDAGEALPKDPPKGVLFRERLVGAMRGDPKSGATGPSKFIGGLGDMALAKQWTELPGMTEEVIITEIKAIMDKKPDGKSPNSFKYFNSAMATLSGALSAPPMQPNHGNADVRPQAAPAYTLNPEDFQDE